MRLLRALALASVVGAWVAIVAGGFTTATGSGLGCREPVLCGEAYRGAEVEITHRVIAWVEGLFVLALLVLVLRRYRHWLPVRNFTVLAFVLIVAQATLGAVSVAAGFGDILDSQLYPVLVTVHLALATAFLIVAVLNAAIVFWGTPPSLATIGASPAARPTETGSPSER